MGKITRFVKQLNFRIKMRKVLQESSREELDILLDETKKEIERRNTRKKK